MTLLWLLPASGISGTDRPERRPGGGIRDLLPSQSYRRCERFLPVVTFSIGFIWDSLTLTVIDSLLDKPDFCSATRQGCRGHDRDRPAPAGRRLSPPLGRQAGAALPVGNPVPLGGSFPATWCFTSRALRGHKPSTSSCSSSYFSSGTSFCTTGSAMQHFSRYCLPSA